MHSSKKSSKVSHATAIFILAMFVTTQQSHAASFSDVPEDHENYDAITDLESMHIIQGYPDGLFHPDQIVSRAEALKIITSDNQYNHGFNDPLPSLYSDVPSSHSLELYIYMATLNDVVAGYPDGTFKPDNPVTRGEIAKMYMKTVKIVPPPPVSARFTDTPLELELAPYIDYIVDKNLIDASPPLFHINDGITRAEVAEMMYRDHVIDYHGLERYESGKRISNPICAEDETFYSLEEALKNPLEVCALEISGIRDDHQYHFLSSDIGTLKNLKVLNIAQKGLRDISGEINELKELRYLYLQENNLRNLEFIHNLPKLETLAAHANDLTELFDVEWLDDSGNLSNLRKLDVRGNYLTLLPDSKKLPSLKLIRVTDNYIPKTELDSFRKAIPGVVVESMWQNITSDGE